MALSGRTPAEKLAAILDIPEGGSLSSCESSALLLFLTAGRRSSFKVYGGVATKAASTRASAGRSAGRPWWPTIIS